MIPEAIACRSFVVRIDPRVRVVTAAAFATVTALSAQVAVAAAAGAAALGLAVAARLPVRALARRLIPLNAFVAMVAVSFLLTSPGPALAAWGAVRISTEGAGLAALVALKANAIVLVITVLLGTLDAVHLGHALERLRIPAKWTRLLLFTVRYLEVFHRESIRLRQAMTVRAFRPRANWHTLRTYGYLAGMLLVRAFDRSERVLAAMKCRGYTGRFPAMDPAPLDWADRAFAAGACGVVAALVAGNYF